MYLLILLFPLLSFFICGLFGRKVGYEGVKIISCGLLFFTLVSSLVLFYEVILCKTNVYICLWTWFDIGVLSNDIEFLFDHVVVSMLVLVSLVSFLVHLFSTSYMDGDPHLQRFMSYLSLFTFFMILLVTSNNIIQLFIGWEGVGLCSYLLIGFWFTRVQANKAAIKAMIINKIGDIGLLLGIILIWKFLGGFSYQSVFSSLLLFKSKTLLNGLALLLLIGVIGKSAQIGLHTWLPDAMEGPTPVSALIHAATMVTAGVFLIIRMSPLFEKASVILLVIVLVGSLTAFFTSTIGLTQNDLKKVIAYSTCSQLGYMTMICGFSQYNVGLFHLINHGFFKALLFLSAGSLIHAMIDEQDIRKGGNMRFLMPLSYSCILIGSVSLMGLPFLTGFYSKDLILELICGEFILAFAFWLGLVAAFFTSFYSFRLIYFSFFNNFQGSIENLKSIHEGLWNLLFPLILLLILSITGGFILQFQILKDELPVMVSSISKFFPFILSLGGALLSMLLGVFLNKLWGRILSPFFIKIYAFLNGAWYFDNVINYYLVRPLFNFGYYISYKFVDNQILEFIGPTKVYSNIRGIANVLTNFHLGSTSVYIFLMIIFVLCLLYKI